MYRDAKSLLHYLINANEEMQHIREIEDSINSMAVISAMRYDSTGGTTGYSEVSKVERYVEKMIDLKDELEKCKSRLAFAESIKTADILSKQEYELIEWLQLGGKLSQFALNKGLYKSTVYKIRDRSLKKILSYADKVNQNKENYYGKQKKN